MVFFSSSNVPAHSVQERRCRLRSGSAVESPAARSGSSSRISLHFIIMSFRRCSADALARDASYKFSQLRPQRFIRAEQQRLGSGLTQLQNFSDLAVIHLLVLVH